MIVSTTGDASSRSSPEDAGAALRKNTVAAVGWVEIAPDATLTWVDVKLENPEPGLRDQRIGELRVADEASDPTESTHACVALTLTERPCVAAWTLPMLIAAAVAGATAPICTFTRGGTVTLTV
jgi:hypothetical protein